MATDWCLGMRQSIIISGPHIDGSIIKQFSLYRFQNIVDVTITNVVLVNNEKGP
jgi:hypothetical protein